MTSSGTYGFQPSVGDLVLNAFHRIGLRGTEIQQQHLNDAALEANFVQVEFSNRQPNLWLSELYQVSLVQGTATYTLPARMIAPMAVYMTVTPSGGDNPFDRILNPISTYEYASLPDKTTQAPPTCYWYNRQIAPQVTLWQVPDGNATYVLNLQILSQPQDANLPLGVTPQIPYRWFDAFTAALAARLAEIYPDTLTKSKGPTAVSDMWAKAERAWQIASKEDIEYVPTYIYPALGGYYGSNR
jgi:hypothetical protein